jgi:hypothetical protein
MASMATCLVCFKPIINTEKYISIDLCRGLQNLSVGTPLEVAYCIDCFLSLAPEEVIKKLRLCNKNLDSEWHCPNCKTPLSEINLKEWSSGRIYLCDKCNKFQPRAENTYYK